MREKLADLCHEQWSGWMEHLFSKCLENVDGHAMIPKEFVARWKRQMDTPYKDLSEDEQNSDRREADKFLAVINEKR